MLPHACRLLLAVALSAAKAEPAHELPVVGTVTFTGPVTLADQMSGITAHGPWVFVCPDEGTALDMLRRQSDDEYVHVAAFDLLPDAPADKKSEIDMEGLASDGRYLYALGSHSLARREVKPQGSYQKNRQRMASFGPDDDKNRDSNRNRIFRLAFDGSGALTSREQISLRGLLQHDPILQRFVDIPSKENGIDIEGLAVRDGRLYLGFRGPVLRENFVPVLVLKFDRPDEYELRFLHLNGRGVRDLATVDEGFLVIGGPMGDGVGSYLLYLWNGDDCVPGSGAPGGKVTPLGVIPLRGHAKPEGLLVLTADQQHWRVLVVEDGQREPGGRIFEVKKP